MSGTSIDVQSPPFPLCEVCRGRAGIARCRECDGEFCDEHFPTSEHDCEEEE